MAAATPSQRLQAGDVGGEAGHRDPFPAALDNAQQPRMQIAFRTRAAAIEGIGRIADHREHALVAQPRQGGFVGGRPDHRIGVELPVAGMQDEARVGADRDRVGLGYGVGQRNQLDIEGADLDAAGKRHLDDRNLVDKPGLGELAHQHRAGEAGRIDGAAQSRPEVMDGAEMIFVRVGEQQADDVIATRLEIARIGRHDRHTGRVAGCEGDPEIDHQPSAAVRRSVAVEVEVHADLAGPAQSAGRRVRRRRYRRSWLGVQAMNRKQAFERQILIRTRDRGRALA